MPGFWNQMAFGCLQIFERSVERLGKVSIAAHRYAFGGYKNTYVLKICNLPQSNKDERCSFKSSSKLLILLKDSQLPPSEPSDFNNLKYCLGLGKWGSCFKENPSF